jgi:hypothetical protein
MAGSFLCAPKTVARAAWTRSRNISGALHNPTGCGRLSPENQVMKW